MRVGHGNEGFHGGEEKAEEKDCDYTYHTPFHLTFQIFKLATSSSSTPHCRAMSSMKHLQELRNMVWLRERSRLMRMTSRLY